MKHSERIDIRVTPEIKEALKKIEDRSRFIRDAIIEKLHKVAAIERLKKTANKKF